jgi:hypothetical protein
MSYQETEYRGFTIKIEQDTDAGDPRKEWDKLGTMVCFHSRYNLGDDHSFDSPDDLKEFLKEEKAIYLPLFLYDHSGITMSTGTFSCPWDSGQVGIIYLTEKEAIAEYGKDFDAEKIREYLKNGVKTYDHFLTGAVFGWIVEDENDEQLDSCWSYYGHDEIDEKTGCAVQCGRDAIDYRIEQQIKKHSDHLKTQIKNHVPLRLREPMPAFA